MDHGCILVNNLFSENKFSNNKQSMFRFNVAKHLGDTMLLEIEAESLYGDRERLKA